MDAIGGEAVPLPYREFSMGEDDVLFISNASGGGYGDPLDRDPAAVLRDVQEGVVSTEAARAIYGVVVTDGQVDQQATEATRSRMREERQEDLSQVAVVHRPPSETGDGDRHPLRENLEIIQLVDGGYVRCVRCGHILCRDTDDWMAACNVKRLPPTRAGALMAPLLDEFVLEEHYCPGCSVLLNTEVVEKGPSLTEEPASASERAPSPSGRGMG